MKQFTSILVMVIILVTSVSCRAEPDFVKNHFIGSQFSELNKKYRGAGISDECPGDTIQKVRTKYGKAPACNTITLSSKFGFTHDLWAVSVDNKMVLFNDAYGNSSSRQIRSFETLNNFFGDAKPSLIYQGKDAEGFRSYIAFWKLDDGYAFANAFCPIEKVAGADKVTSKLRDCFYKRAMINRFYIFKEPDDMKKVEMEY